MSQTPRLDSCDPLSSSVPPRTPGPLGRNDAGDPNVCAQPGDTPGSLGVNDGAAQLASEGTSTAGGGGPVPVRMLQSMVMSKLPPDLKIPKNMSKPGKWLIHAESGYMRWLQDHKNWYIRLSAALASSMLKGLAELLQDPQGWQLFSTWVSGTVPKDGDDLGELILDDDDWADYMRKAPGLSDQINNKLGDFAGGIRAKMALEDRDTLQGSVQINFHAEVGGKYGGYLTGYQILHGTNDDVGGLGITGTYQAQRTRTSSGFSYVVTFDNLEYVWNDIEDHQSQYALDIAFDDYFKMLAVLGWGVPEPQDYIVRIKWNPEAPVSIAVNL